MLPRKLLRDAKLPIAGGIPILIHTPGTNGLMLKSSDWRAKNLDAGKNGTAFSPMHRDIPSIRIAGLQRRR